MSLQLKSRFNWLFWLVLTVLFAFLSRPLEPTEAAWFQTPPTATVANGLRTVTVNTPNGELTVKLPDDIRTGDTVSGSIVAKPAGDTEVERDQNRTAMRSRVLRMMLSRAAGGSGIGGTQAPPIEITVPLAETKTPNVQTLPRFGDTTKFQMNVVAPGELSLAQNVQSVMIPIDNVVQTADQSAKFNVPKLSQTGHPVEITGPFDGNASNSKINLTPLKGDQAPKPEDDPTLDVIAESPRLAIVDIPPDLKGRSLIDILDNGTSGSGVVRNVAVSLSAPKTSLNKGETTTLTIDVTGLDGLTEPIPMTIAARGVISMSGGMYQTMTISPPDVVNGGFITTRSITGLLAGGWSASATVVTFPGSFDLCLNDDASSSKLRLSSFNGGFDAVFPDGGYAEGNSATKKKGCVIDFIFSSKDLKLNATVDACAHTGRAELTAKKVKYTITDSNTTDNICGIK